MKSLPIHPLSALVGASLCATVLAAAAMSTPAPAGGPGSVHPRAMVNEVATVTGVSIPLGATETVLTVPFDKFLVVESIQITSIVTPDPGTSYNLVFELYEELGGVQTLKRFYTTGGNPITGSGTGLVFRPGSKLVIKNTSFDTATEYDYAIYGYVVDA